MNAKSIVKEIKNQANPQKAVQLQRYFKTGKGEYGEGDIFIGLTLPQIRKLAKKFQDASLETISELMASPLHEVRSCALLILVEQFSKADDKEKIVKLYLKNKKYINNWDLVDQSAPYILGAHSLKMQNTREMEKLIKSASIWDRRIGMLATFAFIKNNQPDIVYRLAQELLTDEEDLMHKAVGWMLREAGNREPDQLLRFIDKNGKRMPRTMLRYAIEKFPIKTRTRILKETRS